MLQTGQIDDRTVEKYEKEAKEKNRESWWIAYIMDTSEEERIKGKTVECGRAHFETREKRYTILDAPGHKNYVPYMISGASQADVACLIISARSGEFEAGFNRGGQTCEHVQLANTLGIKHLVLVINKMDCCNWNKERYIEILNKMKPFLKSCGYKWNSIKHIPVSSQKGINIVKPIHNEECPWYKEGTFISILDNLKKIKRDKKSYLRIPIMDRYRDMGMIMAIGKVESNFIQLGDNLLCMPNGQIGEVCKLMIDNEQVKIADTGENVLVGLKGISEKDIFGGSVLCELKNFCPKAIIVQSQIQLLQLISHKPIFSIGYQAIFHTHNLAIECTVLSIPHKIQKKTKKKSKRPVSFLKSNEPGIVEFKLSQPSCIEKFSTYPQLGRFTVRDEGKTIAIGKVIGVTTYSNLTN